MTETRSRVLANWTTEDAQWHTVGVVPAGFTWIVKNITIGNDSNGSFRVQVRASAALGGAYIDLVRRELAIDETLITETWFVMEENDHLDFLGLGLHMGLWVSGAELPMPTQP